MRITNPFNNHIILRSLYFQLFGFVIRTLNKYVSASQFVSSAILCLSKEIYDRMKDNFHINAFSIYDHLKIFISRESPEDSL